MSIIPAIPRPSIAPNVSQQINLNNSRTISSDQIYFSNGGVDSIFYSGYNFINKFVVDGIIWNYSGSAVSWLGAFAGFYADKIYVTGTIGAEAENGNATAISVGAIGSLVDNSGTIIAISRSGQANGITHYGGPALKVFNSSLIAAQSLSDGPAGVSNAVGVAAYNGGFLYNSSSGSILAEARNAVAITFGRGGPLAETGPQIVNDGRIEAKSLAPEIPSVGIWAASLPVEPMWIVNNGIIKADVAIKDGSAAWPEIPATTRITNNASGLIDGDIRLILGDDIVTNKGSITGNVSLGTGNDKFDSSAGTWIGWGDLGWGNDRFDGGSAGERVTGGRNADQLFGNGGNDLLLGGLGDDLIVGGAGNDALYGEYGNDLIETLEGDRVDAGQGNDVVVLGDLTFERVDGGDGFDTLVLPSGLSAIDLGSVMADPRVVHFEAVRLQGASAVLKAADLTALLDQLRIEGQSGRSLVLVGSWSGPTTVQIDGQAFRSYNANGRTILVSETVTVTIDVSAPGGLIGLAPVAAGAPAPLLDANSGVTLASNLRSDQSWVMSEELRIDAEETWKNSNGTPVIYSSIESKITNFGELTVSGGNGLTRALGISNLQVLENYGTISAIGTGTAYASTYEASSWGGLDNHGTIVALAQQGNAHAVTARSPLWQDIANSGTIRAESLGAQATGAIFMTSGIDATASNSGTIEAIGKTAATALHLDGNIRFNNSGTIAATTSTPSTPESNRAILVSGSYSTAQITNSGSIIGNYAILVDDFSIINTTLSNDLNGVLNGNIILARGNDYVLNSGNIIGTIDLGAGNDFFELQGGHVSGALQGGLGTDTFRIAGSQSQFTVSQGNHVLLSGVSGSFELNGFEYIQFDNGRLSLRPNTGQSIDFLGTASAYQGAMNNIRDFDGNNVGGSGGWLHIGAADVNGDGDIDQILVNKTAGRFAEVGRESDGLVYFDDYGRGGQTRVVGIYIDPLVQSGQVQRGSDHDSQRRFQNDLQIENINKVLGAGDYDHDGLQEVYFGLTDGTAYLHAYMHADGNIRYANYQSQQQVIDFFSSNGWAASTYDGWFS